MGKRITQQARGRGSLTFRVRPRAYRYKINYPKLNATGQGKIIKLLNSSGHSAPLAKVQIKKEIFFIPAANGTYEGQEIMINEKREGDVFENGDILKLKDVPLGTKIYNIESAPGKGGVYARSAGYSGVVGDKKGKFVEIILNKRKIKLNENCRVVIGVAAGDGRLNKPLLKAGKQHHIMKSKGRKWHRTSAVKVNAVDHPFGGGRGKRIKSKIAKRNAPPGKKVGHLRPRQTGRKKR